MTRDEILDAIKASGELTALADAGNAAAIVEALNAKTIEHRDSTLYGPVLLRKKLPAEVVEGALRSFEAAASQSATMRAFIQVFYNTGFDFSDEMTRSNIDDLVAGGMPQQLADALKGIGVWLTALSGDSPATIEQVSEALQSRASSALYALVWQRYQETLEQMNSGNVTTIEQAKAFFAGA